MAIVLTFTESALPVNQPVSVGSLKAVVGSLDVTNYETGGFDLETVPTKLTKNLFMVPLAAFTDQNQAFTPSITDPTTILMETSAGAETTNDTDGGAMLVMIYGL